jgi:DNA-binding MarR family transcriptional regulator
MDFCGPDARIAAVPPLVVSLQEPYQQRRYEVTERTQHRLLFGQARLYQTNTRQGGPMPLKSRSVQMADFSLSDFLPYKIGVVLDSVSRVFAERYLGSANLTIPEWRALAVIAESGSLSPTAIGHRTTMDKVKVSRATQSLVTKGLLLQSPDPADGRGRLLRLTRKGAATHARMVPIATGVEAEVFSNLTRAETAALDKILTKLGSQLETAGPDA